MILFTEKSYPSEIHTEIFKEKGIYIWNLLANYLEVWISIESIQEGS